MAELRMRKMSTDDGRCNLTARTGVAVTETPLAFSGSRCRLWLSPYPALGEWWR